MEEILRVVMLEWIHYEKNDSLSWQGSMWEPEGHFIHQSSKEYAGENIGVPPKFVYWCPKPLLFSRSVKSDSLQPHGL